MVNIPKDWAQALAEQFQQPYWKKLWDTVEEEYRTQQVFPPREQIWNALLYTPLKEVKVVILGQDPYHNDGQAHGLCFSVNEGIAIPPSLVNIYKELQSDMGIKPPTHGNLESWANQGVLLLNTSLTVRAHAANSHSKIGWRKFTDAIISAVNQEDRPIVFILWGNAAQSKKKLLNNPNHLVLEAAHPSPLSVYRGFLGSRPFSKTNRFLQEHQVDPIDWEIVESENKV